jgi:CubicO group peptidase (beta-lactamase class C family)
MSHNWLDFEIYVNDLMIQKHIPGVAVAVSSKGKVIYQKGFGYRDLHKKLPVTPETIFGIASVTKSFTAAAIMELQQEGRLSVDDPVVEYIPELRIPGFDKMNEMNIHHLLSHTTGLPPIKRREEINRLEDHLEYMSRLSVEILGKPGEYFSYSNDAFLLLGLIIERLTGRLFRRYITTRFLDRLDMVRSTFSIEELMKFENVTVPYTFNKMNDHYESHKWPSLGNYEVGGGIRSNVLDLLKYGQIYLNEKNSPIKHDVLSRMWTPAYQILPQTFYGYALMMTPYQGVTLVEHSGGQPGVSSNFGFIPEKELAVAVLTNASGAPAGDIWLAAVNNVLGLPLEQKAGVEPDYGMSELESEKFIGIYESDEGGRLEIKKNGNELTAWIEEESFKLRAADERTLVIKESEWPIPFYFDERNMPWAVFFGMRMLRKTNGK